MSLSKLELESLSQEIRRDIFFITKNAKSGHTGGCSSSVELMTSLYFGGILRYNPENPNDPNRDRVLVRGHLGPLRYKIFSMLGWIDPSELLTYRSLNSRLQGHEDMSKVPGVDITPSGSLGMLLSYGVGASFAAKTNNLDFKTYVFLGDGEEQEGNVSEAARHAGNLGLDNLIVIIDKNKKQLSHPTSYSDNLSDIKKIWEGYGWDVREILDGHDFEDIEDVFNSVNSGQRSPTMIIANTIKGKGIGGCENHYSGYHTVSTAKIEDVESAINNQNLLLEGKDIKQILSRVRRDIPQPNEVFLKNPKPLELDFNVARVDYHNLLGALVDYIRELNYTFANSDNNLYVLTADLIREDVIPVLGLDNPKTRFIDVGLREQHMTAMAHGLAVTDKSSGILIDAGEEFLYRNADQLNVLSQGKSPIVIIGNMGGIGGAKNGQTHQPSGQSGMLTLMPGIRCLEPADAPDLFNSLNAAFNYRLGPTYIRVHNGPLPNITSDKRNTTDYVVREGRNPSVTIVSNGLTMKGCLDAADILESKGIESRLINVINRETLGEYFVSNVVPQAPLVSVYNGNPRSLSYPISEAILKSGRNYPSKIVSHGFEFGTSGDLEDLIKYFEFDGEGISKLVEKSL
ncbi:MAG: hypothetical protein M1165_00225 [Candidatus Pacearchaeota archaeon]|nr:hypothetical protein [Candidatus Pacearchaeota archaeon]MDE1848684.1 hypothetical protein [Nanoarchaeota archaeon]